MQVTVTNLAQYGVVSDVASFQTPANAWSSSRNVSFEDGGVRRSGNRIEVMVPAVSRVNKIYPKAGRIYYTNSENVYFNTGLGNTSISQTGVTYTPAEEWFITELSNVLVFNNDANVPQVLLPDDLELQDMPAWGEEGGTTVAWRSRIIRAYKNFLFAIGTIEDGIEYNQRLRWSDLALPNSPPSSWDATSTTNSAGFNDLSESRGDLVDGVPLGDNFILYTTSEVYLVQYVGGNEIFRFRKVFDNLSILAPECAVQINGGHFLITTSDIVIHNGTSWSSIVQDRVKSQLFEAIGSADYGRVKAQYYPAKQEVWVLYPSSSTGDLTKAAIYNLRSETWTFRDLPSVTAIAYGVIPTEDAGIIDTQTQTINSDLNIINGVGQDFISSSLLVASNDLTWYAMDEGISGTQSLPSSITKRNLDFDEWGVENHRHKQITRIYPQFRGSGEVYISVGVSENPFDSPRWSEAVPFNIPTGRKVDFRTTGRYVSVRFESTENTDWTLLSYAIEFEPKGNK